MRQLVAPISFITDLITIVAGKATLVFAVALFVLSGCSNHYVPDASSYDLDIVPDFESNNVIALINSQKSSKDVLLSNTGINKTYANLKDWTDIAIEITQRELTNKKMTVEKHSSKQLRMSIDNVYAMVNGFTNEGEVYLKVETSSGYKHSYTGRITSYAGPYSYGSFERTMDASVMRAVAEMLRDEEIIAFLKK